MKLLGAISAAVLLAVSGHAQELVSASFDPALLKISDQISFEATYPGCVSVATGTASSLPARSALLRLDDTQAVEDIEFRTLLDEDLGYMLLDEDLADRVTSDHLNYDPIAAGHNPSRCFGRRPVEVLGEIEIDQTRYAELLLFPVTISDRRELTFNHSVVVTLDGQAVLPEELLERDELILSVSRDRYTTALTGDVEYIVVTSSALAEALRPLVVYKNETGYVTELRLIEDILPTQTGRDDAEKLREYLKEFHAAGGKYVLLAGDETVLPIRHAYPNSATVMPPRDALQICDLYFADLTGDWDADNDGIWGEKYADNPDLVPELLVGRLPINSAVEATNYVNKLIKYETDPGGDDRSYLERAFFFSSDQMRDHGTNGQHGLIAGAYPDWFEIDTVSAVEQATGADPSPTNLDPAMLTPVLQSGFGIINVIAHGRSDGFVLKSSGYNNWPKTYMLTEDGGHGRFDSYADPDRPAFYYSLACDNGGFDLDQPPINHATENMAQSLIGDEGGAVGFVAYSRWGWISSSHLLQKAFFDALFAHPERTAVEALYASKAAYYYHADLVYGLNYFGDPTLKVYTKSPSESELAARVGKHGLNIKVQVDGAPAECGLVLAEDGVIIGEFVTDANGDYTIDYPFAVGVEYRISSVPESGTIAQIDYIASMATDVEDEDDPVLPNEFALHQNYPNPFNPSTTIAFDLPHISPVRLTVFNVLGQTVATLVDRTMPSGSHEIDWQATGEYGQRVASGVYFYRLETEQGIAARKMVLLK